MPYEDEDLLAKYQILEKKDKEAEEQIEKYKNMTFAQVIQCPENKWRLERCEKEQEQVFQSIIKKREELRHLKEDQKELFAEYFMDFLAGKVVSINDFFYENCGETDAISFFKLKKKILRKRFENERTP